MINDDSGVRTLVTIMLQRLGFEVLTAHDGESGLELVASAQPDLVILDDMMPGIDGFEVLKRLKSDPSVSNIPVISLGGRAESQALDRWKELGADFSLTVPILHSDLIFTVTKVLGDQPRRE